MGWIARVVVSSLLMASIGGGFAIGRLVPDDLVVAQEQSGRDGEAPYAVRTSGNAMNTGVAEALKNINLERAASRDSTIANVLVIEKVTYERSAGGVVAKGIVRDLAAPRSLRVVIDAYDEKGTYRNSDASEVSTQEGLTSFSVALADDEAFQTFNVRFLSGQTEVKQRSARDPIPGLPPLLAEDGLFAGDLTEVSDRLSSLGYVADGQQIQGDVATLAVVKRFRRDHGTSGPDMVTIGDLLALRLVSSRARTLVDLKGY